MKRIGGLRLCAVLAAALFPLFSAGSVSAGSREIGGYVAQAEDRFVRNVWNFIKNFQTPQSIGGHSWKYNQYYWMEPWVFGSSYRSYIDTMDMAYVACHGAPWVMACHDGIADVDLRNAPGYGDLPSGGDLEFLVVESCSTIIAFPDSGFDWQGWRYNGPGGIFRGMHQAMGFRTLSYSDNGIPNYFALRCRANQIVWSAWFSAVQDERSSPVGGSPQPQPGVAYPGWASAIMAQKCKDDRLGSYSADPTTADLLYSVWEE
jgi:Family of unknown function (DUF6345)